MKPLAITMGDPCGIGPEIVAMAFARRAAGAALVVGDAAVMRRAAALVAPSLRVKTLANPGDYTGQEDDLLPVLEPPGLPAGLAALAPGRIEAAAGAAAARCIERAVQAVQAGDAAALVTAPIHKGALAAAGIGHPGHTEMLQALAGGPPVRMMLANDELRVVLVTIHVALRRAIESLSVAGVLETLRIAAQVMPRPRIAVAGLNPHAGEGGLFGDEEIRIIGPAVEAARAEGLDASGPYAPDTVFMRARRGEFDLVVAMTHDHGLIPVKYLGVERGVNVTLGLPFVRTSPDHGTAFDLAGRASADPASLVAAIEMARRLALSGAWPPAAPRS